MAGESTAKDALIAELLGDVGNLHDEVKAINKTIPIMAKEAKDQLNPIIDKIINTSDTIRYDCLTLTETSKASLITLTYQLEKQIEIQADIQKKETTEQLKEIIETSIKQATTNQLNNLNKAQKWIYPGICALCGILGAAIAATAAHYANNDVMIYKYGQALYGNWPQIPEPIKKKIQEAIGN